MSKRKVTLGDRWKVRNLQVGYKMSIEFLSSLFMFNVFLFELR
jgi:hypothetical protein